MNMELDLKEVPGYSREQFQELLAWKLKSERFDSREKAQDYEKAIDKLKGDIEDYEKKIAKARADIERYQKARDEYAARAEYCEQLLFVDGVEEQV